MGNGILRSLNEILFNLSFNHKGSICKEADYIRIDLYYNCLSLHNEDLELLLEKWGDNINATFNNNKLCLEDSEGCYVEWSKEEFTSMLNSI